MKKKLFFIFLMAILILPMGCSLKRDTMEDITIYTTSYPIEYITNALYGKHSTINSIYPKGVINSEYNLTDVEIKEYSKSNLFIFDGLSKEQSYINTMLTNNKNLKIIDATKTIDYEYGEKELWINPSNVLMAARNIKDGLDEYVSNKYLKNEIDENYSTLELTVSKLESKIYLMVEECDSPTIVVSNNALSFLTKYGFEVYSLENTSELTDKTRETVKSLVNNGKVNYIFLFNQDEKNDDIAALEATGKVKCVYLNDLTNLSESDYKDNKDYVSIMNDNIDLLRAEIYND